jgi:hypothetical protein
MPSWVRVCVAAVRAAGFADFFRSTSDNRRAGGTESFAASAASATAWHRGQSASALEQQLAFVTRYVITNSFTFFKSVYVGGGDLSAS